MRGRLVGDLAGSDGREQQEHPGVVLRVAGDVAFGGKCERSMAPELIENAKCSTKVDVYSFGCVLYEIILGEHCYFDMDLKGVAVMMKSDSHLVLPEGPSGNAADHRAGNARRWGMEALLSDRACLLDEAMLAAGQAASHNERDRADHQGVESGDLGHERDARVPGTVVWPSPPLVFPLQVVACLVFRSVCFGMNCVHESKSRSPMRRREMTLVIGHLWGGQSDYSPSVLHKKGKGSDKQVTKRMEMKGFTVIHHLVVFW